MNFRASTPPWILGGTAACLAGVIFLTAPQSSHAIDEAIAAQPPISFATAEAIVQARCITCHAEVPANPGYASAPQGVMLDTPERIRDHAERMLVNAVRTHTMPLGNLTAMTETERTLLGAWIVQGADLGAPGPVQLEIADVGAAPSSFAGPAEEAKFVFSTRCAACHGDSGRGDGPAAGNLDPRPRNYADAAWQESVTDAELAKVIVGGGTAVGKAAVMPPSSDLADKPEVVQELIRMIRGFRP